MTDPYRILNVRRDASAGEIKSAYRRLAKELHPDRNPGDRRAEQRFREATQAYELLGDPEKRAAYDRGLIDGDGKPRGGFGFGFGGAGADPRARSGFETIFEKAFGGGFARTGGSQAGGAGPSDLNSAFEELLKGRQTRSGAGTGRALRGTDVRHRLEVDFMTAARGGRERVLIRNGRQLEVDVPAGTSDGQVLRLRGQGNASPGGGPAGDALIEIAVRPHPHFERRGHDIHLELPVSLPEALLGGKVKVPTIDGAVRIAIAPGANSGQTLRLRGKGIAFADGTRGDQLVRLVVMLPGPGERAALGALRRVAEEHPYEVRREVETA